LAGEFGRICIFTVFGFDPLPTPESLPYPADVRVVDSARPDRAK
jgi:hypothetical protein